MEKCYVCWNNEKLYQLLLRINCSVQTWNKLAAKAVGLDRNEQNNAVGSLTYQCQVGMGSIQPVYEWVWSDPPHVLAWEIKCSTMHWFETDVTCDLRNMCVEVALDSAAACTYVAQWSVRSRSTATHVLVRDAVWGVTVLWCHGCSVIWITGKQPCQGCCIAVQSNVSFWYVLFWVIFMAWGIVWGLQQKHLKIFHNSELYTAITASLYEVNVLLTPRWTIICFDGPPYNKSYICSHLYDVLKLLC